MTAQLTIHVDTLLPVQELARIADRLEDTTPLLDAVGVGMVANIGDRFESGTGPDGTEWKKSRRVELGGGQTLVQDGHLRDSYTHAVADGELVVGSNLIYAGIHNYGGTIKPKNGKFLAFDLGGNVGSVVVEKVEMPARPVLGIGDDDKDLIQDETRVFILDAIGGGARP